MDKPRFEIVCDEKLMSLIEEHCFSEIRTEVGGFLVGEVLDGKAIVTHVLKAKHTAAQMTQLTFTHKTWDAAFAEMSKIKPDAELIGWFHSHPNFGVFLSDHDKFIQTQFFGTDGKITIVVDPIRGKRGWFISQDKDVIPYSKEEDTNIERIGESATASDDNIPILSNKNFGPSVSLGRVFAISAIFSIFSMLGGYILASTMTTSGSQIAILEQRVSYITGILDSHGWNEPFVEPEASPAPVEVPKSPSAQTTQPKISSPKPVVKKSSSATSKISTGPSPKPTQKEVLKFPAKKPSPTSSPTTSPTTKPTPTETPESDPTNPSPVKP